jgi:membrane protein DedA with SNARE-associated domain
LVVPIRQLGARPALEDLFNAVLDFARAHREWAPIIVFILAFGESIAFVSLILPFWGALVALGAVIGTESVLFFAVWIAASVGAALGDWISYWLGWHYAEQIGRMWPLSKYPDLLPRGQVFFDKWGVWAIVIGRFSGPFRATVPIIAGSTRMSPWKFQAANWPSAFLWAFVLLVFGGGIGQLIQWIGGWFH